MEKKYDLIVIGSGSGLNVAIRAAHLYDWKVAVIEEGPLGGTCLNRGCIPSKIVIHAADVADQIREAKKFGITATIENIDFSFITKRASDFVDAEAAEMEEGIKNDDKIDVYKVRGEFVDSKTLKVGDETITGERILISAGTRPFVPPIEGIENVEYMTSREALRQTVQPKSMIVVGGGYISTELGHFYGGLGTKITIIEMGDKLIGREDGDISKTFTEVFSKKYNVILNSKTTKVEERDGKKIVTIEAKDGTTQTLEADALLMTTGRRSNSDYLKLENTDIKVNERGFIEVNEFMETSVHNVWALGDIVGKAPFKHGANWEAEHVLINIKGKEKRAVDYSIMPHAIFTSPQIAGVGLTEEEAKEKGLEYEIKKMMYKDTGMGKALEEEDGFVKFILDPKENKILGCHIIGPEASILIHEVVVALKAAKGDVNAIALSIHIHPALSEVVQWALAKG